MPLRLLRIKEVKRPGLGLSLGSSALELRGLVLGTLGTRKAQNRIHALGFPPSY